VTILKENVEKADEEIAELDKLVECGREVSCEGGWQISSSV